MKVDEGVSNCVSEMNLWTEERVTMKISNLQNNQKSPVDAEMDTEYVQKSIPNEHK